ncbi:sensor histidine kinase [Streptomyces boluensis]|uniref:histidine kinase n=1 Tax=Streptomyces boluensis TaxID=1775135 RepID=A0A964XRC9_9ACTN|nr:sensor histidine kinase [Streptomyces boluensis]NBE56483.1 sensor histidine kinase [Streptomyces boluensis]
MKDPTPEAARDQDWSAGASPLTRQVQRALQRVRAFDRRRPLVWDVTLTAFYVTVSLIDYSSGGWRTIARNLDAPHPLVLLLCLGFSVPLLWRRSHPMAVLLAMAPVSLVNSWTGILLQAALLQFIVVFNLALRGSRKPVLWTLPLITAPTVIGALRFPEDSWDLQVFPALWGYTMVVLLAMAVRTRKEYTAALVERARQLEVERDQQARLAAAAERTRIAREMHDIIGHNLSVITGLADGGSYAAKKHPERAGQALEAIAGTSREALTELRRLLGVLRDDTPPADLTPQPGLADLDSLVSGVRSAGLPVRMRMRGTPAEDADTAGRELTVYRVVQEALTNTMKHAGPTARATVDVGHGPSGLTVTVTDDGHGHSAPATDGRGLTGMRERTALYDGTLEAGPLPRPPGGWQVRMHLPSTPGPSGPREEDEIP